MAAGWATFWRDRAQAAASCPDSAVAPPRPWLIRAALFASSAALLATSQSPEEGHVPVGARTTYTFTRTVEGEAIELTGEQPSALVLVTLRATGLGPFGASSTDAATVMVSGSIEAPDFAEAPPSVSVDLGGGHRLNEASQSFTLSRPLQFEGTCDAPAEDAPCQATFSVELRRSDDGSQGKSLHVAWSFVLSSEGSIQQNQEPQTDLDPPWSVEVEQP